MLVMRPSFLFVMLSIRGLAVEQDRSGFGLPDRPVLTRLRARLVDELDERLVADRLSSGSEVAVPTVRAERPAVRRAEQVRDVRHLHSDAADDVVRREVAED